MRYKRIRYLLAAVGSKVEGGPIPYEMSSDELEFCVERGWMEKFTPYSSTWATTTSCCQGDGQR